jgi:hypothetical protein
MSLPMRAHLHLSPRVRFGLVAASTLLGLAFGWAALALPWRAESPLALLGWGLAVLHLCAAVALSWRPARSGRALSMLALGSLAAAPVFVHAIIATSVEMVQMFGPLGWGLTVGLGAIGWLLLLATVPIGLLLLHLARSA